MAVPGGFPDNVKSSMCPRRLPDLQRVVTRFMDMKSACHPASTPILQLRKLRPREGHSAMPFFSYHFSSTQQLYR